jgi:uncharacterized protein (DUF433 family)
MSKKAPKRQEIGTYLVIDPEVCHGQLTFKGTRVPVDEVLNALAMGDTLDEVHESWPRVPREAVLEALQLAADVVAERFNSKRKAA